MAQLKEHYNNYKFKPKTNKTSTNVDETSSSDDDEEKEKPVRR